VRGATTTTLRKLLASVDLFKGLTSRELNQIVKAGEVAEFAPGSPIVEHGMRASDFYLILEGLARLTVPKKKPRTLGPGDYFGEISVLDGGPRTASVVADGRVLTFRLERSAFTKLLDEHGVIGRKILVEMTGRLRYAESRMSPP
jgi:CRP/FNR family transcriptional regulator, cyclic AMP receptor protein